MNFSYASENSLIDYAKHSATKSEGNSGFTLCRVNTQEIIRAYQENIEDYLKKKVHLPLHMGAEPQNSFEEVPRGPLYGKLTTRHHRLRDYVSPNQSCRVFGDFGQTS